MLALARRAIEAAVTGRPAPPPADTPGAVLRRGVFVTLEERSGGEGGRALRGCIGRIAGDRPLGEAIPVVAASAALEDPRFPPVAADEVAQLRVEISVLSEPERADPVDPGRLVVGRDGVVVRRGSAVGLLLPRVATEHGLSPAEFLAAACRKAGLAPDAWREPGTRVFTFQADAFGE